MRRIHGQRLAGDVAARVRGSRSKRASNRYIVDATSLDARLGTKEGLGGLGASAGRLGTMERGRRFGRKTMIVGP